jgi:hypothetical protein
MPSTNEALRQCCAPVSAVVIIHECCQATVLQRLVHQLTAPADAQCTIQPRSGVAHSKDNVTIDLRKAGCRECALHRQHNLFSQLACQ